ncbi:MAG: hypothetical protein OEV30_05265 [Ignavibacteria bacterium]|nr:hypothetical protein [Ignavibacteria bacterium]
MIRTILILLIGYLLWIFFRIFRRIWSPGNRTNNTVRGGSPGGEGKRKKFPDIRDADFEEIDPEKNGG